MPSTDLTPARLRALAEEWLMLDLQGSMTKAEMARYDRLPLLMAQALKGLADWHAGLESEIAGDVECTRHELCMAVDAGADQADIDRLNRAVWTLFERASALRLVFRRIDPLAARVIELEAQNARLTGALQAIAAHGSHPGGYCGCHQATFINIARAALEALNAK